MLRIAEINAKKFKTTLEQKLTDVLEKSLTDDITGDIFKDPVSLDCCGKNIEKEKAVEIQAKDSRCITCREVFTSFTDDHLLKQMADEYRQLKAEYDIEAMLDNQEQKAESEITVSPAPVPSAPPLECNDDLPPLPDEEYDASLSAQKRSLISPLKFFEEKSRSDNLSALYLGSKTYSAYCSYDFIRTSTPSILPALESKEHDDSVLDKITKDILSSSNPSNQTGIGLFSKRDAQESYENIRLPNVAILTGVIPKKNTMNIVLLGCKNNYFLRAINPDESDRQSATNISFRYADWDTRCNVFSFNSAEDAELFLCNQNMHDGYAPQLILSFGNNPWGGRSLLSYVERYPEKPEKKGRTACFVDYSDIYLNHTFEYIPNLDSLRFLSDPKPHFASSYRTRIKAKALLSHFVDLLNHFVDVLAKSKEPENKGFISKILTQFRR